MGEAIISRRGGTVVTGEVRLVDDNSLAGVSVVIPELVNKNNFILEITEELYFHPQRVQFVGAVCINGQIKELQAWYTSRRITVSSDGVSFDKTTGRITGTSNIFADVPFRYVAW